MIVINGFVQNSYYSFAIIQIQKLYDLTQKNLEVIYLISQSEVVYC